MAGIEIEHVTRKFPDGTVAIDDVSLDIADGEFMILVGPSGCGKSTLLRSIVGLEDVTSGQVRIAGEDVTDKAPRERNLAMVFQNYALYPHLTVRRNMSFPLEIRKVDKGEIDDRVNRAADILELDELMDRKPAALSGGQRQRVAMGRAIVREPQAFLLDEPLSNLDAQLRVQMRFELSQLQKRLGTTTVYVTHDQTEAMTLGDRVAVMRKGIIQQVDTPKALYLDPANVFVAGFIGSPAMNFFPAEVSGSHVTLPMAEFDVASERDDMRRALEGRDSVVVGIRPEHFDDVSLIDRNERSEGVSFTAKVEQLEWLGSDLFAHFRVGRDKGAKGVDEVAEELGDAGVRSAGDEVTVARIDPASDISEGVDATLWIDLRRAHLFDPESGENLLYGQQPELEEERREAEEGSKDGSRPDAAGDGAGEAVGSATPHQEAAATSTDGLT